MDILWHRKTIGGGNNNGYIKDLEMKMVDISIVRYENVDTLWWSVEILIYLQHYFFFITI